MKERTALLGTLSALYIAQGLPHGFFGGALPLWLMEQDTPISVITLSSLLFLPWALKPLWAPLVDRLEFPGFGRRRSWLVPTQVVAVGLLGLLAWLGPDSLSFRALVPILLGTNLALATSDIAVDAFAVERLSSRDRGLGNTAQTAGYRLGMLLGGGVALQIAEARGWAAALVFVALIQALTLIFSATLREGPRRAPTAVGTFTLPAALLVFVGTSKVAASMATNIHRLWLFDAGISKGDIGFWLGSVGVGLAIAGSVAGGVLLLKTPVERYLLGTGLLHAGVMGAVAIASWLPVGPLALGAVLAEEFTGALFTVGVFSLMMGRVDPAAPAAGYALLASLEVASKLLFGALAGAAAQGLGFPAFFGLCALLALPPLALLGRLRAGTCSS